MKKFLKSVNLKGASAVALLGSMAMAGSAFAQATPIDVSTITDLLTQVGVAVATIGAAVLAVIYGAKAYKWIRSAG